MTAAQKEGEIEQLRAELRSWQGSLARAAASVGLIRRESADMRERLQLSRAAASGASAAEGSLTVLTGWAARSSADTLERLLDPLPDIVWLRERPAPGDEVPVALSNNRYADSFEFVGGFYSMPRYGTVDLTAFFAPFYMMFFGFCMADAGYGLVVLTGGLLLGLKGGVGLRKVSRLSVWCGAATVVFGLLQGSLFGIELVKAEWFARFRGLILLDRDNLFSLALIVGVVQLLLAMGIKVYSRARAFGIRHIFQTLGWMIVLLTLAGAVGLPMLGIAIPGFAPGSAPFFAGLGVGLFMMLFLNSPGRNPLFNFGAGLWNTYNDVTGTLGDLLSYIRLFAIGLAGGILAQVFNDLALGMSPDIPVLRQVVMLLILLIGHGLNLFMSVLSSFVHPMRLTFVEFYKNAGFEPGGRAFAPLKREKQ